MSAALTLVLVALAGLPLAVRLAGVRAEVVPLAPLLGAGYLAVAALLEVAVGGPPLLDAVLALLAGGLLPLAAARRERRRGVLLPRPDRRLRWRELVLVGAPAAVLGWVLSPLQRTEVAYDGRSIWLYHARMLTGGHAVYLEQAHAYPFSHPDYPPLVPATVAFGWHLAGGIDYRTGQLVIALLTACATVLVGLAVARAIGGTWWLGALAAATTVAVAYGSWDRIATNGYADPLNAALVLAALTYGVLDRAGRLPLALGLTVLAAASKNEGLVFALVVVAVLAGRRLQERQWRVRAALVADRWHFLTAVVLVAAWPVVVRARGLGSDLTGGSVLTAGQRDPAFRTGVVLHALGPLLVPAAVGVLGLLVVAALGTSDQRRRVGWWVGALLLCGGSLLLVYAYGPLEIHSWVYSSLFRTTMTLRAGGLVAAVYATGIVVSTISGLVRPFRTDPAIL